MSNIKKIVILIFITLIFILTIFLVFKKDSPIEYKTEIKNDISVLIYDSSEEEYVYHNNIPVGDYIVNRTLSKCLGGGIIDEYDNENGTVIFYTDGSDKCTLYFDLVPTISTYLNSNQPAGYRGTSHNSSASQNLYRFVGAFQTSDAAYDGIVDNYICLGSNASTCPDDNMYRIIGVVAANDSSTGLEAGMVKVIKNNSIGSYTWDGGTSLSDPNRSINLSNYETWRQGSTTSSVDPSSGLFPTWENSYLNTTILNQTYLNGLSFKNNIASVKWHCYVGQSAPSASSEYSSPLCSSTSSKISVMYVGDWLNSYGSSTASISNKGWILQTTNAGQTDDGNGTYFYTGMQWTMANHGYYYSTYATNGQNYIWASYILSNAGTIDYHYYVSYYFYCSGQGSVTCSTSGAMASRPVFFLNNDVKVSSGSGTYADPIRVL